MVEVFKTNVQKPDEADRIIRVLLRYFPGCKINFDLDDCDKVLRIEGQALNSDDIIRIMESSKYECVCME